jgi:hypothetical protein
MIRKFMTRQGLALTAGILLCAFVFSGCDKNEDNIVSTPVSGLMAFNLAPDQPAVDVVLSGNLLGGAPLAYGSFTGTYLNIYAGNRRLDSYNAVNNQLLDSMTYAFQGDKYYSVFVVGANGNYRNIITQDNYDSLSAASGKAYVRYINAIPGSASSDVMISSGGTNVVNSSAMFGQVSPFVAVSPGQLMVNVSGENSVNANRTITVAQQRAYTILLAGMPNAADSSQAVQIRFIENGTITN